MVFVSRVTDPVNGSANGPPGEPVGKAGVPAVIDQRIAPVTMANERLLAVPGPLAPLFPAGGLQRGWSVGVAGIGGWSVALALLGAALGADGWSACVGSEELGLVAADELGLRLDRVLMVETPGPKQLPMVIAALVEVVDIVCLGPTKSIGVGDSRRLMAMAREQNSVLLHLDGGRSWPQALDVTLTAHPGPWSGIGVGHGRLQSRSMAVTAIGRRSMAKPRRVDVLLPGPGGGIEVGDGHDGRNPGRGGPADGGLATAGGVPVAAAISKGGVGEWPAFV